MRQTPSLVVSIPRITCLCRALRASPCFAYMKSREVSERTRLRGWERDGRSSRAARGRPLAPATAFSQATQLAATRFILIALLPAVIIKRKHVSLGDALATRISALTVRARNCDYRNNALKTSTRDGRHQSCSTECFNTRDLLFSGLRARVPDLRAAPSPYFSPCVGWREITPLATIIN